MQGEPAQVANFTAREWGLVEAFSLLIVDVIPKGTSIYIIGLTIHSHLTRQIR